jgi:O-antigen/teichoic acid export membrane protein
MSMGCLNNIISNSKYYAYVFWFSVSSALLAVVLNYYFINAYGILGAALATLIVIVFINCCKIVLIYAVYKIHPYNSKTLSIVGSILLIYGMTYFIPTLVHPLLSILIRSLLVVGLFLIPLFLFRWSSDIEALLDRFKNRF